MSDDASADPPMGPPMLKRKEVEHEGAPLHQGAPAKRYREGYPPHLSHYYHHYQYGYPSAHHYFPGTARPHQFSTPLPPAIPAPVCTPPRGQELDTDSDTDSGGTPTLDSVSPSRRILPDAKSPHYLERNVYYSKLKEKPGKKLEEALQKSVWDETKDISNGGKERGVDLELYETLWGAVDDFVLNRRKKKTRAKAAVKLMFTVLLTASPELYKESIMKESRKLMQSEVFKPWKLQKAIDTTAVGGLNYGAIETIRHQVEGLDKYEKGCFPSRATVARTAGELEKHAAAHFGLDFVEVPSEHGLSYIFDPATFLRLLVNAQGMTDIAKTGSKEAPMMLAMTLDGARFTSELGHVSSGLKDVDPRIICPTTGLPITHFQSRDVCYIFQLTFGKDCTAMYDVCFKDFFEFFSGEVVCPATADEPELSNFIVVTPQDMASHWKTTGRGGSSSTHFCVCCDCQSGEKPLCKRGDDMCENCKSCVGEGIERCYCYPVSDGQHLKETQQLLQSYVDEALDSEFAKLQAVRLKSRIEHDPTIALKEERPLHVDYEWTTDSGKKSFSKLIWAELKHRMAEDRPAELEDIMHLELEERVAILKELLRKEQAIWKARETMDRQQFAKWFTAEQAIPCNLHLVCRVMEKLFWSFLAECMLKYKDGVDAKTRIAFVKAVEVHMCTVVLGTKKDPGQWTFPLKANKGGGQTVEPRNMTGNHARKCILGLKSLATLAYSPIFDQAALNPQHMRTVNETWESSWHGIMDTFVPLMDTLARHQDFTDEEIRIFHSLCAKFMHQYCDLFQGEGVTNYIHLIGAGHLTYYLHKYRNLSKFCQQGWEALNQLLKQFYFNNTNHGGNQKNGVRGEHCKALIRLCQRRTMWLLGHGDEFFKSGGKSRAMEEDDQEETDERYIL